MVSVAVLANATTVKILYLDRVDVNVPMTYVHIVPKVWSQFGRTVCAAASRNKLEEVCHLYALLAGKDHTVMYPTVVHGPSVLTTVTAPFHQEMTPTNFPTASARSSG
jgi:hypothetical protein